MYGNELPPAGIVTGIGRCAKRGSRMFGASGTKKGILHADYVCSKRSNPRERDQDFRRYWPKAKAKKKKHLLHRLGEKVLIQSRDTIEVWYCLPNPQRFANCNIWLPGQDSNLQPSG